MISLRKTRAYGLHQSMPGANPVTTDVHSDGSAIDGRTRPRWDTLIAVANDWSRPVDVVLRAFDQAGLLQTWGDLAEKRYELKSRHGYAMTFIPNNVFPDSPTDWVGRVEVEFSVSAIPFGSIPGPELFPLAVYLGGGGWVPDHWNAAGEQCALYELGPDLPSISAARTVWRSASAITFEGPNHQKAQGQDYRTGVSIINGDAHDVTAFLEFTEFDWYNKNLALTYRSEEIELLAGRQVVRHVDEFIPELTRIGNREGWLRLRTDQPVRLMLQTFILSSGGTGFMSGVPWQ